MALTTTIVVDTSVNTIVLSSSSIDGAVETITYDAVTNQVTIAARSAILINFVEFLNLCDQINIFETAILFNFSLVNILTTKPFIQVASTELHDVGAGNWNLTCSPLTGSNICEYQATKSTLKFYMVSRDADVILEFPEWVLFLQSLNHYRLSIKAF